MNRQKLEIEIDMLQGNINRMCVTNDDAELASMQQWAKRRIDQIYLYNHQRLREQERLNANDVYKFKAKKK